MGGLVHQHGGCRGRGAGGGRRGIGGPELEGAVDTRRVVAVYIDPDDRTMHAIVSATGVVRAQYIGE